MWYADEHATSHFCASADGRRAPGVDGGPALSGRLRLAPLPNPARQRPRRARPPHRQAPGMRRPDGAGWAACVQCRRTRGPAAGLLASAPPAAAGVPRRARRAVACAAPPQSARVWPPHQSVDAGLGCPSELRRRLDAQGRQWRSHPQDLEASGHRLEARQAVDYQPRPRVRPKKRQRDRLIALATAHHEWALGFADEVWWSRLLQPQLHAWAAGDQPLRLVEQAVAKDDPDRKALACYGLLVRRAQQDEVLWLRFVDGRPVSALTTQFLGWCAPRLEALSVPVWVLIW